MVQFVILPIVINGRKDLLSYRRLEAKIKREIQELQVSLKAKEVKMKKLTEKQLVRSLYFTCGIIVICNILSQYL